MKSYFGVHWWRSAGASFSGLFAILSLNLSMATFFKNSLLSVVSTSSFSLWSTVLLDSHGAALQVLLAPRVICNWVRCGWANTLKRRFTIINMDLSLLNSFFFYHLWSLNMGNSWKHMWSPEFRNWPLIPKFICNWSILNWNWSFLQNNNSTN